MVTEGKIRKIKTVYGYNISVISLRCPNCKKVYEKPLGHYNRAISIGAPVYCGKVCAGIGRRSNETEEEKLRIKYFYDALIRLSDEGKLKKQRAEYFKRDYAAHPEKYRKQRVNQKENHLKHIRKPEYKKWKQGYDQIHRAKKFYGKYWESSIALRQLGSIVDNRQAKQQQKSINKSQNRKRYANKDTKRKELESCTMGLYQPS